MPLAQFSKLTEVRERNRVYWYEILERAHCASFMSLLRLDRWLSMVESSAGAVNFVGFAASVRGAIESSADTRYALGDVPAGLASTFRLATRAVRGVLDTVVLAEDLENDLIHFSHGRKLRKGEEPLHAGHITKTMQEYLNALEGGASGPVHECYAELCNVTHPAADSVLYLLEKKDDGSIIFCPTADEEAIQEFRQRWGNTLGFAISTSMLYPIMTLKILNRFGLKELRTPIVESISLENVEEWRVLDLGLTEEFPSGV
jgi:hypothetical protein